MLFLALMKVMCVFSVSHHGMCPDGLVRCFLACSVEQRNNLKALEIISLCSLFSFLLQGQAFFTQLNIEAKTGHLSDWDRSSQGFPSAIIQVSGSRLDPEANKDTYGQKGPWLERGHSEIWWRHSAILRCLGSHSLPLK